MAESKHRLLTVAILLIISLVVGLVAWISFGNVRSIYLKATEQVIIELKQDFLKASVANVIEGIELTRKLEKGYYRDLIDSRYNDLNSGFDTEKTEFIDHFLMEFPIASDGVGQECWTVLLWNTTSKDIIYDPNKVVQDNLHKTLEFLDQSLYHYRTIVHRDVTGLWGVSAEFIENEVKGKVADRIRDMRFADESYIWINGVLNYDGGDNYGIRVVHPNLPETEGMYLSTDMEDIQGNKPYLVELEGVKQHGELFFRYWFKRLESEDIAEKLTYATLYKNYDWIIAMGIHIDDLEAYTIKTSEQSDRLAILLSLRLVVILIALVALAIALVITIEHFHHTKATRKIELEANKDILTGAASRRNGTRLLMQAFYEFKSGKPSPAILLFDVDHLKHVNDSFGHDMGDRLLKEVAQAISGKIRSSDVIIRWGGDEFIVLLCGVKRENCIEICNKLVKAVANLRLSQNGETITPSISLGATFFTRSDRDFSEALNRADHALYQAKEAGRGLARFLV